jgi:colanic acid/amylovoran biosynthesis glycosyltransferase
MRIIIFEGSFSTTPFINRLVKGLVLKHEVYILGFNESVSKKIKNVHYVSLGSNQNKLSFFKTALSFSFKNGFFSFFKTIKLLLKKNRKQIQQQNFKTALEQIKPDIIHVQWPSLLSWCEPFLLIKKYKIVLSQRGSQTNIVPFVDDSNFQYLKKWYPKIDGFHSVSKAISEKGDLIWSDSSKIDDVIYTGLQLEQFVFSKNYSKSKPLKIISVGRAHWVKGYDYALKCCKILKETGIPFQYTIVGGAEDEELQYLINSLGLEKTVRLLPRLPQNNVFKLMESASLLLISSLAEGLPNVAVEAMALGVPVLSTACGGVAELIDNDANGWIVPTRNPEAMALAIERFIELPCETIEKIREAARRKVETQHSEKQMLEAIEHLYSLAQKK